MGEKTPSKLILTIVHEIDSDSMDELRETLEAMRGYGSAEIVSATSPEFNKKTDPNGTCAGLLLECVKALSR